MPDPKRFSFRSPVTGLEAERTRIMQKNNDHKSSSHTHSPSHGGMHGGDRSNSSAGRKNWSGTDKGRK
jgi:hypothetical protein